MTSTTASTEQHDRSEPSGVAHPSRDSGVEEPAESRRWRWGSLVVAGLGYLLLSVLVWWNVWSKHPTSTAICGCGDPSLFTWFLNWPAYAIAHGHNPFFSTAMGYPHGVNLLANTSELAIGVLLAPVTWIFGATATLNVALTLAPAASGLAMFVLLRRWTSWLPAAFLGGLLYGFSPLVLSNFEAAHLQVVMLFVPPLVVACLDELLVRQRHRPTRVGILIGLLLTLQFFVGTEVLAIMVICGAVGLVLMLGYARLRRPDVFRERAPYVVRGFKAAAVTTVVLLAIPAGFALFGRASLPGPIWPVPLSQLTTRFTPYFIPSSPGTAGWTFGYNGISPSEQYLGIGLVVVLVGGLIIWYRDRRLWLFGAVGLLAIGLALGAANPIFSLFPLLENIVPTRFDAVLYFCVAVMLGIILDHAYHGVRTRVAATRSPRQHGNDSERVPAVAGAAAALVLAAAAIVPIAVYWGQGLPMATRTVALPTWFKTAASSQGPHQVLLIFPNAVSQESPMTYQTLNDMSYSMVNEGGPGGATTRGGKQRSAENLLAALSLPKYVNGYSKKAKVVTPKKITEVRNALDAWRVTTVVMPDEPDLPYYDRIPSVPIAAALMTAAIGEQPRYQNGAWVWTDVRTSGPPLPLSIKAFFVCMVRHSVASATSCVVHSNVE